ncbi:MAG: hypothetical protein ACREAC_14220, partial [Blastocatellia bacterium]
MRPAGRNRLRIRLADALSTPTVQRLQNELIEACIAAAKQNHLTRDEAEAGLSSLFSSAWNEAERAIRVLPASRRALNHDSQV